jgi:6,7-dimethyl-8-ribityllumazine synthase
MLTATALRASTATTGTVHAAVDGQLHRFTAFDADGLRALLKIAPGTLVPVAFGVLRVKFQNKSVHEVGDA